MIALSPHIFDTAPKQFVVAMIIDKDPELGFLLRDTFIACKLTVGYGGETRQARSFRILRDDDASGVQYAGFPAAIIIAV